MNAPPRNPAGALSNGAHGDIGALDEETALARLKGWLVRLFGRSSDSAAALVPFPEIDSRYDNAAIEKLLEAMRRQRSETSGGMIQMVHFGALPQTIGRPWAGYVERAMHLGESILSKRLGQDDLYVRYADFAYIVVFADMPDDADAPDQAKTLSEDIQHRLLLDRELALQVPIREVITRITDLLEDETPGKIVKLGEALDSNAKLKNKSKKACGAAKKAAPAKPAEPVAKVKPAPKAAQPPAKPKTKPKPKAVEEPRSKFKSLSADSAGGPASVIPDWMGKFSAAFRPMIHISNRVVGIHAGVPMRITPDHEKLYGEAVYPKGAEGDLTTAIDVMLTRYIIDELRLAVGAGNKTQISTMTTLTSLATSRELKDIIFDLNKNESQQLILEIAGVRPSTPIGQLSETTGKLRGKVRSINLLMQLRDKKFGSFADAGLNAVGCNVSARDLREMSAEWVANAMLKFVENAKSAKLGTYFHGVDTKFLLDAATKAGVDFITGDAFEPVVSQPGTPRMLKK